MAAVLTAVISRTSAPILARPTTTLAVVKHMTDHQDQPPAATSAPEESSGAALLTASAELSPHPPATQPKMPPTPPLRSKDGRLALTNTTLTVRGQSFLLLELERAELTPVRWILWFLLGGLGLATVMIAFLQNWLRTEPAMAGMALTALLLAYGHRGTNRLRLHRLGREMVNFALPGETAPLQRLTAEVNRRIFRVHDQAASEAATMLAAADEATRLAALAAQAQNAANSDENIIYAI